ncbi:MAG TPA: sigma-70 family RNA polymerase sigma factor [Verrucomicrobiae bacterium]|nr:sigma-70 family RNA polymerase sigma factor [Verrucomicrobiae bacterium]
MNDHELLREYVERYSEEAFSELVARHINLVFSTALRIVRDSALAKDVAQSVFIQLARKASTIRSGNSLPGWLYRVTRCLAINAVRKDRTRREHETNAMNQSDQESSATWESILPHLDDAMNTLSAADQNAVVLRFFEGQSWREVGTALTLNEDTAQKRVSRAVEKLRTYFQLRGVITSAVLVASAMAANAVHAAPVGLASTVSSASLAGAAGVGIFGSLSTYLQTLIMKKSTYAVLSAVIIAATSLPFIKSKAGEPETPITAASVRQGLVLDYQFDHFEAGTILTDHSGMGNDGQIVGAQWTRDVERGGIYTFTPPNQYIRVPNNDSLCPTQITLSVWIKTANTGDTWRRVFDKSWTNGFALSIGGGHTPNNRLLGDADMEIGMKLNNNKGVAHSDQPVTDGQWHHLAVTYDGAVEIVYVDGVAQKHLARWIGEVPKNDYDLTIGMNLVDPNPEFNEVGSSFDGSIDEPMIFNRALSAAEIRFLHESQRK